jgi:hypothetical protein
VEQGPLGVESVWKIDGRCCAECRPRRPEAFRWPGTREPRLTDTR